MDIGLTENMVVEIDAEKVMADKGYDSKEFMEWINKQGMSAVTPSRSNALEPREVGMSIKNAIWLNVFLARSNITAEFSPGSRKRLSTSGAFCILSVL